MPRNRTETSDSTELPFVPLTFSVRPGIPMSTQAPDTAQLTAMPELPMAPVVIPPVANWRDSHRWKPLIGTPSRTPIPEGVLVPDPSPVPSLGAAEAGDGALNASPSGSLADGRRRKEHVHRPPLMFLREVATNSLISASEGQSLPVEASEAPLQRLPAENRRNDENIAPNTLKSVRNADKGTEDPKYGFGNDDRIDWLFARKYQDGHPDIQRDAEILEKLLSSTTQAAVWSNDGSQNHMDQMHEVAETIPERSIFVGMAIHDSGPNNQLGGIGQNGISSVASAISTFEVHEDHEDDGFDKAKPPVSSNNELPQQTAVDSCITGGPAATAKGGGEILVRTIVATHSESAPQGVIQSNSGNQYTPHLVGEPACAAKATSSDKYTKDDDNSFRGGHIDVRMDPSKYLLTDRIIKPLSKVVCVNAIDLPRAHKRNDDEFDLHFGDIFKVVRVYRDGWAQCQKEDVPESDRADTDRAHPRASTMGPRRHSATSKATASDLRYLPLAAVTRIENLGRYCREVSIDGQSNSRIDVSRNQNGQQRPAFKGGPVRLPERQESLGKEAAADEVSILTFMAKIRSKWSTSRSKLSTSASGKSRKASPKRRDSKNIMTMTWNGDRESKGWARTSIMKHFAVQEPVGARI